MQINVAQLLKSSIGSVRNYKIDENIDISGYEVSALGEVELIHTNRSILVRGTVKTQIELTCSRCLGPVKCPLTLQIEEEYFPSIDINTGVVLPMPDEPGSFTIDEHNVIDLDEAIRQCALLAIPMKPLCREDCAGLCPTCGQNLNQGPCKCPKKPVDSRWAKLFELAKNDNTSKQKGTKQYGTSTKAKIRQGSPGRKTAAY